MNENEWKEYLMGEGKEVATFRRVMVSSLKPIKKGMKEQVRILPITKEEIKHLEWCTLCTQDKPENGGRRAKYTGFLGFEKPKEQCVGGRKECIPWSFSLCEDCYSSIPTMKLLEVLSATGEMIIYSVVKNGEAQENLDRVLPYAREAEKIAKRMSRLYEKQKEKNEQHEGVLSEVRGRLQSTREELSKITIQKSLRITELEKERDKFKQLYGQLKIGEQK